MSGQWLRLQRVREVQLASAQAAVQREREQLDRAQAQVRQAQSALAGEQHAKQALAQQTMARVSQHSGGGGAVGGVTALRESQAWSGALDGRIALARDGVAHAHAAAQLQQAQLDARRASLRQAQAKLEKVKRVAEEQQQVQRSAAATAEQGRLDEAAALQWAQQRGPGRRA